MSPRAGPSTSRTRNHRPRRFHFYCQEITFGDDTFQMQFGCIRHNSTTATHSENNTSQMITNCASFTKNAEEPILTNYRQAVLNLVSRQNENVPFSSKVRMSPLRRGFS